MCPGVVHMHVVVHTCEDVQHAYVSVVYVILRKKQALVIVYPLYSLCVAGCRNWKWEDRGMCGLCVVPSFLPPPPY